MAEISELKAYWIPTRSGISCHCYFKTEADKVIVHHKYKRCLAMAEWCNSGMVVETFACFRPRTTKKLEQKLEEAKK